MSTYVVSPLINGSLDIFKQRWKKIAKNFKSAGSIAMSDDGLHLCIFEGFTLWKDFEVAFKGMLETLWGLLHFPVCIVRLSETSLEIINV